MPQQNNYHAVIIHSNNHDDGASLIDESMHDILDVHDMNVSSKQKLHSTLYEVIKNPLYEPIYDASGNRMVEPSPDLVFVGVSCEVDLKELKKQNIKVKLKAVAGNLQHFDSGIKCVRNDLPVDKNQNENSIPVRFYICEIVKPIPLKKAIPFILNEMLSVYAWKNAATWITQKGLGYFGFALGMNANAPRTIGYIREVLEDKDWIERPVPINM